MRPKSAQTQQPAWIRHVDYWQGVYGEDACFVYVIQAESGPIKVGVAKDPEARLRAHQTSNFEELTLLHVLPGSHRQEADLHRRLKGARVRGEWFAGPAVPAFIEWVERHGEHLIRQHELFGDTPSLDLTPRPRTGQGIPSGAFIGPGLQSRWRTGDGKQREVTVRFVDPDTLTRTTSPPKRGNSSWVTASIEPWNGRTPDWLDQAA